MALAGAARRRRGPGLVSGLRRPARADAAIRHLVANSLRGLVGATNAAPVHYADAVVSTVRRAVQGGDPDQVALVALDLANALYDSVCELERRER